MPRRVAISTLNASTIDILNTIRANLTPEYQNLVPVVEKETDIPKVGEVLYGYPSLANLFINALVTRIASVRVKSALFNNAYADLKKGYLEYGETVEEVFVNIVKAREFSVEKAPSREFKRSIPDVKTAFHAMNYRVQYPITIQDEDLRTAFLSMDGVQDLIAKIVNSVSVGAEYDEYLLFKYLMIKAITKGKMYVANSGATERESAIAFRGMSNALTFMSNKYNESGVTTITKTDDQQIFMDAKYNATFDVDVLASAFNMDKATFIGKLRLIDDWTTFDNERFSVIREACDMLEEVTEDELSLMKDVTAVLIDSEWFQVYDNHFKFSEKYVASGEYWNYFLNVWKTVSHSPFSNAVVFVKENSFNAIDVPETITVEVVDKSIAEHGSVLTLAYENEGATFFNGSPIFVQTRLATENGVGVHKYGSYIFPPNASAVGVEVNLGDYTYANGSVEPTLEVGATIELTRVNNVGA